MDFTQISTLDSIVITFLIVGYGYFILFMSFREAKLLRAFYQLNAFDKGIQSLIFGFILWYFTSLSLKIPIASLEILISNINIIFLIQLYYALIIISILSKNIDVLIQKQIE